MSSSCVLRRTATERRPATRPARSDGPATLLRHHTVRIPTLETDRLVIREFTAADLDAAYGLLDVDLAGDDLATDGARTRDTRLRWLEWAAASYEQLAYLRQPPYTDRAITLRATGELVGACGLVPCLGPFRQLPGWDAAGEAPEASVTQGGTALQGAQGPNRPARFTPEVGLFWAVASAHRRRGYAAEAAGALVTYAFDALELLRVVATTRHDNMASVGVMRRLGMRVLSNPLPEPRWFQVVGVLRTA